MIFTTMALSSRYIFVTVGSTRFDALIAAASSVDFLREVRRRCLASLRERFSLAPLSYHARRLHLLASALF